MNLPKSFEALVYNEFGKPDQVLKLKKASLSDCEKGEVIIQMQASALHPSDLGLINGTYGLLPVLPTVAGREGVGTVYSVGEGVDDKLIGQPVALPYGTGAWQEYIKEKAENLILFPLLCHLINWQFLF